MRRCLVVVGLLAATAGADVPSRRPGPVCRADGDCVLSTFKGCCAHECCPSGPRAWLASELDRAQARCGVRECAAPPACPPTPCAPRGAEGLVAACEAGRCVARRASVRDDPDFCSADDECVSSSFEGCCGACCPVSPRAVTRRRAELESQQCAGVRCAARDCGDIACAQVVPSPIRPVCRANRCVAERLNEVPVPPPVAECRADADCGVDQSPPPGATCWESPCGCCPASRVVPLQQARPPPTRRTPPPSTPFGLSPGGPPAPACSPCPQPVPVTPRCLAGRCVGR
jgi:hypothetical protein